MASDAPYLKDQFSSRALFGFNLNGKGNVFLHGDLICTYTLSEYIFDIYVDGLCIISVKINFEKSRF